MDFAFSKTEKLIYDSANDFLINESIIDLARDMERKLPGYSEEIWAKMADLGWLGINIPDKYGGCEGDLIEFILILQALGRNLLIGPFIPTMISSYAILKFGSETQKETYLPAISDGTCIFAPALINPDPKIHDDFANESLLDKNNSVNISGTKVFVPFAHVADYFLYTAVFENDQHVFIIDAKTDSVECVQLNAIFGSEFSEIKIANAVVSADNVLGNRDQGNDIVNYINQVGGLAYSAYALGILEKVLEMTAGYAKKRLQFGKPIGSFQAIQHQFADMATSIDKVKFLTYQAAWKITNGLFALRDISMAKACASNTLRTALLHAVKIHGGIGITEEYDLQLYFRMAKIVELSFGDCDYHFKIIASEIGL